MKEFVGLFCPYHLDLPMYYWPLEKVYNCQDTTCRIVAGHWTQGDVELVADSLGNRARIYQIDRED